MKRGLHILIIILILTLFSTSALAINVYQDKEAELIYTSKELTIKQITTAQVAIDYNGNKHLNWIEANLNYYPKQTYRQTILQESHNPSIYDQTPDDITYRIKKPNEQATITGEYIIKTKNEYKPVTKKIQFPIQNLPQEFQQYLEATELIDINEDITSTASILASGKDDLFQVSQDIAIWITNTVEYDLTTITADANQKASWVLKHKYGVCDELSVLYIAMLRSIGVPARMASGITYTNSDLFSEKWNPHAWVEVYFPDQGWIPFDLTYNQFGYVDASHIKFKDSATAESLITSFQWEGTNLEDIEVEIQDTRFNMEVMSATGTITDPMTITTELLYDEAGFGSFNVLEIQTQNNENYYVSSSLYVSAPNEIELEKDTIPIYLKPRESKTYYVLIKVADNLQKKYIYTMPVGTYTSFGYQNTIDFEVSADYYTSSIQQVNSYLKKEAPETNANNDVTINCELSITQAYQNEDVAVTCIIINTGNTYLTDGEFCIESKDVTIADPCEIGTIPINHDITFKRTITGQTTGSKEFSISTNFEDFKTNEKYSFVVVDKPNIQITKILAADTINFGEKGNITIGLESLSITEPQNIRLQVTIGNQRLEWAITKVDRATEFIIPFDSRVLQEGQNTINASISWNDNSSHFETTKFEPITLAPLNLWEKVIVFFYGLGV